MLLMLTPAMVCVLGFPANVKAAEPPCHGMEQAEQAPEAPMLAGDCLKNDIAPGDMVDMPLPQGASILLAFLLPVMLAAQPLRHRPFAPPEKPRRSFDRLHITQRFLQ